MATVTDDMPVSEYLVAKAFGVSGNFSKTKIASCRTVANMLGVTPTSTSLDRRPVSTGLIKLARENMEINLITASWTRIAQESAKVTESNKQEYIDKYSKYVGQKKVVHMGSPYGDRYFTLAGVCHDYETAEPPNSSTDPARIKPLLTSWIADDLFYESVWINEEDYGRKVEWRAQIHQLSKNMDNFAYQYFPDDLQNAISLSYKLSNFFGGNEPSVNYVWTPSCGELNYNPSGLSTGYDGDPYPIFTNNASRKRQAMPGMSFSYGNVYWTRSGDVDYIKTAYTYVVQADGSIRSVLNMYGSRPTLFGFCV